MRITFVPMLAQILAAVIHLPLCYYFVYEQNMGIIGLGIATSITDSVNLAFTLIYCLTCLEETKEAIKWPSLDVLRGWKEYLNLSLPATVILCS